MTRTTIAVILGIVLGLALFGLVLMMDARVAGADADTLFRGPGFMVDKSKWVPLSVDDDVLFCVVNAKDRSDVSCGAVPPGSVLLIPVSPEEGK